MPKWIGGQYFEHLAEDTPIPKPPEPVVNTPAAEVLPGDQPAKPPSLGSVTEPQSSKHTDDKRGRK